MTDERRPVRPGLRGLAEMFLIVVSILCAFALDSWWDGRSDSADRQQLARLLHADFIEARDQVRGSILRGEMRVAASEALMAGLANPAAVGADSLRTLFPSILQPVEAVPAPASYRAAVASGAVTIIDDPALFRAFAAVDQAQTRMDTYSRLAADIHYGGALARLESTIGSLAVLLRTDQAPSRFVPPDYVQMVSRPEVYSASRLATQAGRNLLGSLRTMDSAITSVIEQLEVSGALER
jgi:hypothetical protein